MKRVLNLVLILAAFSQVGFAAGKSAKNPILGTWTLRGRTCEPDGNFLDRMKAKMTRVNRLVYAGEILIISPDGAIRKFSPDGQLVSEGDYVLNKKDLLVSTTDGKPLPKLSRVKFSYGDQFVSTHKGDAQCKDGIVKSSYLKVRTYTHISYDVENGGL